MQPFDKWLLIKPHVLLGKSDYKISREIGINRGTVQRLRNLYFGRDDVRPPDYIRTTHDWKKIQSRYDDGLSWRDLVKEFKISLRSISLAKKRGEIKSRSLSEANLNARAKGRCIYHPTPAQRLATSIRQSTSNSGGKAKWFDVSGIKVQGTWERDLAIKFNEWDVKWEKPRYGKAAWPYMLDGKSKRYTPDFYLPDYKIWVEVKGHWWGDDMRKMVAVMRKYPRRKIILVRKKEYHIAINSPAIPSFLSCV